MKHYPNLCMGFLWGESITEGLFLCGKRYLSTFYLDGSWTSRFASAIQFSLLSVWMGSSMSRLWRMDLIWRHSTNSYKSLSQRWTPTIWRHTSRTRSSFLITARFIRTQQWLQWCWNSESWKLLLIIPHALPVVFASSSCHPTCPTLIQLSSASQEWRPGWSIIMRRHMRHGRMGIVMNMLGGCYMTWHMHQLLRWL